MLCLDFYKWNIYPFLSVPLHLIQLLHPSCSYLHFQGHDSWFAGIFDHTILLKIYSFHVCHNCDHLWTCIQDVETAIDCIIIFSFLRAVFYVCLKYMKCMWKSHLDERVSSSSSTNIKCIIAFSGWCGWKWDNWLPWVYNSYHAHE